MSRTIFISAAYTDGYRQGISGADPVNRWKSEKPVIVFAQGYEDGLADRQLLAINDIDEEVERHFGKKVTQWRIHTSIKLIMMDTQTAEDGRVIMKIHGSNEPKNGKNIIK